MPPSDLPVSAGELAQIQADLNAFMDQSIEIQRTAITQGPTGNVLEAYAHLATVSGTLSQPTASQLQNYDYLIGSLAAWQVRMPVGTDVKARDHLIIGTPAQTLEVQIVLAPESYQGTVRVLASEIKGV